MPAAIQPPTATIPRFALYGEALAPARPRFIHAETIASRSAPQNWTIRTHRHADLHHLLLIETGGGIITAETRRQRFGPGTALVVPAGTVHGFRFDPDTRGHVVTLSDAALHHLTHADPLLASLFAEVRWLAVAAGGVPLTLVLDALVAETAQRPPLAEPAAEALVQLLLVAVARSADRGAAATAPVGRAAALVARYRASVEAQLASGWSVTDHARALGVTAARLRRACVTVTGASAMALLRARLLRAAQHELAFGDRAVAEIGYALGFDDPAYFSRFFARGAGVAPASWRRTWRSGTGAG